jgi:hypothetical protein
VVSFETDVGLAEGFGVDGLLVGFTVGAGANSSQRDSAFVVVVVLPAERSRLTHIQTTPNHNDDHGTRNDAGDRHEGRSDGQTGHHHHHHNNNAFARSVL